MEASEAESQQIVTLNRHDQFKLKTIIDIFKWDLKCMCGNCTETNLTRLQLEHRYNNGGDDRVTKIGTDIYSKIWDFVAIHGQKGQSAVISLFGYYIFVCNPKCNILLTFSIN